VKPLKRFEKYVSAVFKLGKTERLAKSAHSRLDYLSDQERRLHEDLREMVLSEVQLMQVRSAEVARSHVYLSHRFDQILLKIGQDSLKQGDTPQQSSSKGDVGFDSVMDSFYHRLENKFRGSVQDIKERLRVYLPDVEAAALRCGGKPVLDIGCGRGEWLELLNDSEISAFGVDTNSVQITDAQTQGLDVRHQDARTALAAAEDSSLACITAHHVIEHLPFEEVLWIAREALRVLAPGGLLLFETPNVRNVLVGATSFHNDPTHLRPMTDPVLQVLFETIGYHPIELRRLHPHAKLEEFMHKPGFDPELANLLFGAQDLAILGLKPLEGV
jgi:2-polyprenyl-3-methyl-5-hydroxy-6-metoxy-1,4-benzoquinol methylase